MLGLIVRGGMGFLKPGNIDISAMGKFDKLQFHLRFLASDQNPSVPLHALISFFLSSSATANARLLPNR